MSNVVETPRTVTPIDSKMAVEFIGSSDRSSNASYHRQQTAERRRNGVFAVHVHVIDKLQLTIYHRKHEGLLVLFEFVLAQLSSRHLRNSSFISTL